MGNISDALTEAGRALVAASKDKDEDNKEDKHEAFDEILRETFEAVVKARNPNYAAVVLHLIREQAKIAPEHAVENLMDYSGWMKGKDQTALEETLAAITGEPHMDKYLRAGSREIDPRDQKSHIGQIFLTESLGLGAPVTPESAARYTKGIAVTLGEMAVADPKLDTYTRALMEIVRNDAYSPAQKRDALILMNKRKIQSRLETIEPGFIGNHVTPTATTVFSDPALSLKDLQKNYKKFLESLAPESPLTPSATAAYPAVRDAGFNLLEPEQDPDSRGRLRFLKDLMTNYPFHYIVDLHHQALKDYEDIAVPLIHEPAHQNPFTCYEVVKCEFAMHILQFCERSDLKRGNVQKTKGGFSISAEGDKAVIDAIEFAYAHRSPDLARKTSLQVIDRYMSVMGHFHMRGMNFEDVQLPPLEKWAEKTLAIKDHASVVDVTALIAKPKGKNIIDELVPDYMFRDTRHIMVQALYNEIIKHTQGDENALLRVHAGANLADFLSGEQLQALRGSFKEQTAKDTNAVWPSFVRVVQLYIGHRPGSYKIDGTRDGMIAIVNDYLEKGLKGLNAENKKAARTLAPSLTENVDDWGDYETRIPLRDGNFDRLIKLEESPADPAEVQGLLKLRISP